MSIRILYANAKEKTKTVSSLYQFHIIPIINHYYQGIPMYIPFE